MRAVVQRVRSASVVVLAADRDREVARIDRGLLVFVGVERQDAREDAYYFVDDRLDYRHPDIERFWAEGEVDLDRVLESVGARIEPSDAVVEIGCGLGRLTRAIAARARSVTGIDVSEEMLTRARQLNAGVENVAWVHGNGTDLAGIDDASADACVSHVVFQHIPDPNVTLGYVREIGRVLRPGGWAAFQISNDASVHRRRRGVGARLRSIVGRAPRGQPGRTDRREQRRSCWPVRVGREVIDRTLPDRCIPGLRVWRRSRWRRRPRGRSGRPA